MPSGGKKPETGSEEGAGSSMFLKDGWIHLRSTTIITVVATFLAGGGATGLVQLMDRSHPEIESRLDSLEEQLKEQQESQKEADKLTRRILSIVQKAHPVTIGGVDVPIKDLPLDDEGEP